MFYSHEILTDRKHGVATVWLVATLGAKSNTKKVNRKSIEKVDIKNVCKTIMKPEVPLALRLQSNLLYGVSRVHQQQWDYLLSDAQAAQNIIRTLMRTVRNAQLDPNAGKAQPDQLVLVDDPAFAIDNALPALDLDIWDLDLHNKGNSQRSTQSMFSIRSRSGSVGSLHHTSALNINIPSSSNGGGEVYQLPIDHFGGSSAQKSLIGGLNNDEGMLIMDDDLFDFDADGNMRDILPEERDARRAASLAPHVRLGSDSAASGRVRQQHEDAQAVRIVDGDGDFNMDFLDNDFDLPFLPDADPFPLSNGAYMSGALGPGDVPLHLKDKDRILSETEHTSSDTAMAQQKKTRKRSAKKVRFMELDQATQFKNGDLSSWDKDYLDSMDANRKSHERQAIVKSSKKTAAQYVYGAGLNSVGTGIGSERFESPLAIFSGKGLLEKFTGLAAPAIQATKKGTKRMNASSEDEEITPKKRPAFEEEFARGFEDDGILPLNDDFEQSVEIGRDAQSALADYPSSAMPWNKSTSLLSHQQLLSSRPGSQVGRRLTSASPLVGRGSVLPVDLIGEQDEMVMYGRSDSLQPPSQHDIGYGGDFSSANGGGRAVASQDFELFGAAAGVNTQTAADSQWVRSVLDRESNNFFEYVKNSIGDEFGEIAEDIDELGDEFDIAVGSGSRLTNRGKDKATEQERAVSFEQLFVPEQNSHIVAAQAFYHVLTLATKNKVWVHQENGAGEAGFEPFGEIWIGVV